MQRTDIVLNRDTARESGLVVIEPSSHQYKVILQDDEFAIIQFQSLYSFEEYISGFGIVAISKPTEEKWVVLQATPRDDLRGVYYTFPSTSVIVEATRLGISQVNNHLKKFWSVDDLSQTARYRAENAPAYRNVSIGLEKAAAIRKHPPVMSSRMLHINEMYRQKKNAQSLLSAINRTQIAHQKEKGPTQSRPISWLFKGGNPQRRNAGLRPTTHS